jgi:multimeric flavodoxin WrbA
MKVLAIIGSPRKTGNTYRVVEQIKENLLKYNKSIDFEYLFLRDYDLLTCIGCHLCIFQGKDKCPLKDDRSVIESKMSEADGIIYAAPTYTLGVPGLMKNFIDRFAYTCHRPYFFDKVFMAVTTVGGVKGMRPALEQLAILAGGGRLVKKLGLSSPPIPMGGSAQKAAKKIEKASKAFYSALEKPRKKLPGLADWAWFHSFKSLSSVEAYQKVCPADYAYYKERTEYFYPLAGHNVRRLFGKMFKGLMQLSFGFLIEKKKG